MFRRVLLTFLSLALIFTLLPMTAFADEEGVFAASESSAEPPNALVIPCFSTAYIKNRADIIDTLDTPTSVSLWQPSANVISVSAETSFADCPFEPAEGSRCLNAVGADVDASLWRYIKRSYEEPLDLSAYSTLMLALSVRRLSDGDYTAAVTLTSVKGISKRYTVALTPECWNAVMLDLTGFSGSDAISEIRVGIKHDYPQSVNYSYNFQLDCVAASTDRYLARTAVFMSGAYNIYGGESRLSYGYDPMSMTLNIASTLASRCFIESGALTDGIFTDGEAIRVRLVNESDCDSVTLEYATAAQPDYSQNPAQTVALSIDREIQSLYFDTPDFSPTQIRLTFNNVAQGTLTIYSITPFSYYSPIDSEYSALLSNNGGISSCRISDDGKKVVIRGFLNESAAQSYKNSSVELYELLPYEANETIYSDDTSPTATVSVSEQFEFELPLYDDRDGHSRLCSRFAAVLHNKDKARTILLGSPSYITNPETLASSSVAYPDYASKKGLISSSSVLLDTAAAMTELTFNLGHMFTADESGIHYDYGGVAYYIDRDFFERLDASILDANIAGCAVRLRMVLSKPTSPEYAVKLIHPSALPRSTVFYAFNTESAEGVAALECAAAFIAERYMTAESGSCRVSSVIVGGDIDTAYSRYNMGKLTCSEFVDSYTRAFRIIYNTVRSISPKTRLYVSLGNSWDGLRPWDAATSYLGSDLCDVITAQLGSEGGISWRLSICPYSESSERVTDYSSSSSVLNSPVTFVNLPALCTVLSRPQYLYEGSRRGINISDFYDSTLTAEFSDPVAAVCEYCRAYLTVCSDSCAAVESMLLRCTPNAETSHMLKYLDTDDSAEHLATLKSFYGVTELGELVTGYRAGMLSARISEEEKWSESLPTEIKGSASVSTFTGADDLAGWSVSSPVSLSAVESFKGYQNMAFADISGSDDSFYAMLNRFEYPRDLSYAPYISFNCYTEGISSSVTDLTLTVTFFSGIDRVSCTGALNGGLWSFVVCDLGGFSENKTIDGVMLRLSSESFNLSGATLVIGELRASSSKFDSDYLESKFREQRDKYLSANRTEADNKIVWALIILIITALTAELIYIMSRVRKIDIRNKKYEESKRYRY